MDQPKKFAGVALAGALAGLLALAPIAAHAGAQAKVESSGSHSAVVAEDRTIPYEIARNLGGSPGELY